MSHRITSYTLACAAAVAGCTGQSTPAIDHEPAVTSTDVGASVAPRVAKLAYTAFGRELTDTAVHALPEAAVAIEVRSDHGRARMALRHANAALAMDLRDDGKLETGGAFPGPVADLVESLPAPNSQLVVGTAYEAGAPDQAYLEAAFAEGKAVIWQPTRNTPIAIYTDGDRKLVALDVVGYNRAYSLDDAGKIAETQMGPAFHARTDLLFTPETGWVVLRLRRIVQAAIADAETAAFGELASVNHSEFNACLDLGFPLDGLASATDVDFPSCR